MHIYHVGFVVGPNCLEPEADPLKHHWRRRARSFADLTTRYAILVFRISSHQPMALPSLPVQNNIKAPCNVRRQATPRNPFVLQGWKGDRPSRSREHHGLGWGRPYSQLYVSSLLTSYPRMMPAPPRLSSSWCRYVYIRFPTARLRLIFPSFGPGVAALYSTFLTVIPFQYVRS